MMWFRALHTFGLLPILVLIFKGSDKYLLDCQQCQFSFICLQKYAFGYNGIYSLDIRMNRIISFFQSPCFSPLKSTSFLNQSSSSKPVQEVACLAVVSSCSEDGALLDSKGEAPVLQGFKVCPLLRHLPTVNHKVLSWTIIRCHTLDCDRSVLCAELCLPAPHLTTTN